LVDKFHPKFCPGSLGFLESPLTQSIYLLCDNELYISNVRGQK
jgi:hypothetical protein